MTKFALFLMICSSVQGVCTNPHSDYKKYDDFHSCIKSGTTKVVDIVNEFDKPDDVYTRKNLKSEAPF